MIRILIVGFVAGIVKDVNHEDGKPFVPLIFTIFSFIFVANMFGMIGFPGFHAFTPMSHIAVTNVLALLKIVRSVAADVHPALAAVGLGDLA